MFSSYQSLTGRVSAAKNTLVGTATMLTTGYAVYNKGLRQTVHDWVPGYFKRDQPVSTQSRKASQVQSAAQPVSSSNGASTGGGGGVVEELDHGWVVLLLGLVVLGGMRR